jgi:hypothetical protein
MDLVACLPDSIDLGKQLQAYRPEVIIGSSASVLFVMAKDPKLIRVFAALSTDSDSEV